MNGFTAVGMYVLTLGYGIAILSLWLRIAMRLYKISAVSQVGQLVALMTNPFVNPLNALIPDALKTMSRVDWGAFLALILVELLKIISLSLLAFHTLMPVTYLLVYTLADFIKQPCDILFFALLIRVIMSFITPGTRHPFAAFIVELTNPWIVIGRKIIPDISGFDFSPYIMMLIFKVISLFILASLPVSLI